MPRDERILLTGATGFVGGHLLPKLIEAGYLVRCASRHPSPTPSGAEWVRMDVEEPEAVARAMDGCAAAYYLVHGMAGGGGYPEREAWSAGQFARRAAEAGLRRIVYLGGIEPSGPPSRHLSSRLETGRILRAGAVPTVELRAAMIIGHGSGSWQIVRDLAARLPAMVLPRWLHNASWPVHIDDVCRALVFALEMPIEGSVWLDVPGAQRISHRDLIRRVASALRKHPPLVDVPVLTPRLSSYWIALVTRADLHLAQELVEGLRSDLDPTGPIIWDRMVDYRPMTIGRAIRRAIEEEEAVARAA